MNLRFALCFFVVTGAAAALAADPQTASPLLSQAPATNQTAKNGTNEILVAKAPGDKYTNSVGMELVKVPGGYWAGKYEVTQKEYQQIMGSNPSTFSGGRNPVDSVSWNDAMEFCRKLTEKDVKEKAVPEGFAYMLPSEDEWMALAASSTLDNAVTSQQGPRGGSSPVGSLGANSLGLYDVRGNLAELTLGDTSKPYRVARGGSWQDFIEINLRLEFRLYPTPDERKNIYGFRCVLKGK